MRIIGMLVALAIIGWLVKQQLGGPADTSSRQQAMAAQRQQAALPPVPTTVQQVPQFDQDMNQFMDDASQQRAEQMEQELRQ